MKRFWPHVAFASCWTMCLLSVSCFGSTTFCQQRRICARICTISTTRPTTKMVASSSTKWPTLKRTSIKINQWDLNNHFRFIFSFPFLSSHNLVILFTLLIIISNLFCFFLILFAYFIWFIQMIHFIAWLIK
jgi:hypothetical protein